MRARSRAFAQVIACEMHPINAGRVKAHLVADHGQNDANWERWYDHWAHLGYQTLEKQLEARTKTAFAFDDKPTVADLYLIPQLYNASVFKTDVSAYPLLNEIDERCRALEAFDIAMPEKQPDVLGEGAI